MTDADKIMNLQYFYGDPD